MTLTVWAYDHDAAAHHCNTLGDDTFDDLSAAERCARERVAGTNHDTGWAKIVDNAERGRGGDTGVVALLRKTAAGHVRRVYLREPYRRRLVA